MINANEISCAAGRRRSGLSLVAAVGALLAPAGVPAAFAAERVSAPMPVDCMTVRYYVNEHGRAKSIAWAVKNGYSWAQIAEAKRCLRG